jgi:hypothetical protein
MLVVAAAALAAGGLATIGVAAVNRRSDAPPPVPAPGGSPHVRRAVPEGQLPARLWGVTLDDVSKPAPIVASLKALPTKPMARVVFDRGTSPADYAGAIAALHPHSYLMGELVDSSDAKAYTVAAYRQKAVDFINAFGHQVDLWEVGNEVNGEWLGTTSQTVAQITAAYQVVTAAGGRTALTLYYNPNCWSQASHEMFTWAKANIPAEMKAGLDYVFISYYPGDCNNYWPSQAGWQSVFDQLHQMFPNARLGFGESGSSDDGDSGPAKVALVHRYYQLRIHGDNYVGGYFWWYYVEDALPHRGNVIWEALAADMAAPAGS